MRNWRRRSARPRPGNRGQFDGDDGVPEPSAWALGSGYEAAFDLNDLNEQIEREYQTMLDGAIDTAAGGLPVSKILRRGPPGRRSSQRHVHMITT
jgi:hypothetical protein